MFYIARLPVQITHSMLFICLTDIMTATEVKFLNINLNSIYFAEFFESDGNAHAAIVGASSHCDAHQMGWRFRCQLQNLLQMGYRSVPTFYWTEQWFAA